MMNASQAITLLEKVRLDLDLIMADRSASPDSRGFIASE
jgi:hypothetical protein